MASPLRNLQTWLCIWQHSPVLTAFTYPACRHKPLLCHSETSRVIPSEQIINSLKPYLSQGRGVTHAGSVMRTVYLKYCRMSPKGNLCPKIVTQFPWLGLCPRQIHSPAPHDFLLCLQDRQPPTSGLKKHLHGRSLLLSVFLRMPVHVSTCSTLNITLSFFQASDLNSQPTN